MINKQLLDDQAQFELENLSEELGFDLLSYYSPEDNIFTAPEGIFANWNLLAAKKPLDSPEGFRLFFLLVSGLVLPHHVRDEWVPAIYETYQRGKNLIIKAARGMAKSTFARLWLAFRLGLHPDASNMIVRASWEASKSSGEKIAGIIQHNNGFQFFFPNVIPQSSPGQAGSKFSAQSGYALIDTSVDPDVWQSKLAALGSPALATFGIGSKSILGHRVSPNGTLFLDDIHQSESGDSATELEKVVQTFLDHVSKCAEVGSQILIIGTPWDEQDLLSRLDDTDWYETVVTPASRDSHGRPAWPGTPVWPEWVTKDKIAQEFETDLTGTSFSKNMLCDLSQSYDQIFDYGDFASDKVEDFWQKRIGVDYGSASQRGDVKNRSYTAITVIAQNPETLQWVVIDGQAEHYTQAQAEEAVWQLYLKHQPCSLVQIEEQGTGVDFLALLQRSKRMPLIGETVGGKSKEERIERSLQPIFKSRYLLVSDDTTNTFLMRLKHALRRYPHLRKRGDEGWDILDSLYQAVYHCLLQSIDHYDPSKRKRIKRKNPFFALAQMD